jgi:hypothetical protein
MKLFKCQACGQLLYFENRKCEKCGHRLGYLPDDDGMHAVEPAGDLWHALNAPERLYRFCANVEPDVCNWLVSADSPEKYCLACRHNSVIPDISRPENLEAWRKIEVAKHRLFYTLIKLRLPLCNRGDDPQSGLAFNFLSDLPEGRVMTGHDNGLITLALEEADDGAREARRKQLHEPYRTLLGHFRHEVGHYFWDKLVRRGSMLEECRVLFGDDREDYGAALRRHYGREPPAGWQDSFISTYAMSHPWEDFAETWAHYLHIVDALETADAFGIDVRPRLDKSGELTAQIDLDPYRADTVDKMIDAWLPITFAVNNINRSMGQPDVYPFILSPKVIHKLSFVHRLIHDRSKG